jgi:hypothetical protein
MSTPLKRRSPNWLARQSEHDPKVNKNYRRSIKYYRRLFQAWPEWCEDHPGFKEVYKLRDKMNKEAGSIIYAVDHIVPICSDIVSGLHVPWNLEVITIVANNLKSNKWWPDHPFENLDLFGDM